MAKYSLRIKKSAAKELEQVAGKADRRRLVERMQQLSANPRPVGCEKLSGGDDQYRIRQGHYRVLYLINDATGLVTIVKVAHRREVPR